LRDRLGLSTLPVSSVAPFDARPGGGGREGKTAKGISDDIFMGTVYILGLFAGDAVAA